MARTVGAASSPCHGLPSQAACRAVINPFPTSTNCTFNAESAPNAQPMPNDHDTAHRLLKLPIERLTHRLPLRPPASPHGCAHVCSCWQRFNQEAPPPHAFGSPSRTDSLAVHALHRIGNGLMLEANKVATFDQPMPVGNRTGTTQHTVRSSSPLEQVAGKFSKNRRQQKPTCV